MSVAITTHATTDDAHHGEAQVKRIWKAFWILLVLTIIELILGLAIYYIDKGANPSEALILFIKGVITILTLAKAFYIISIFMHLGDEIRNLIMSISVPALLFIWFIFTFLYEGNSYRNLRNTDAGSHPYIEKLKEHQAAPAMKEGEKN